MLFVLIKNIEHLLFLYFDLLYRFEDILISFERKCEKKHKYALKYTASTCFASLCYQLARFSGSDRK